MRKTMNILLFWNYSQLAGEERTPLSRSWVLFKQRAKIVFWILNGPGRWYMFRSFSLLLFMRWLIAGGLLTKPASCLQIERKILQAKENFEKNCRKEGWVCGSFPLPKGLMRIFSIRYRLNRYRLWVFRRRGEERGSLHAQYRKILDFC